MTVARDPFGLHRVCYRRDTGAHAPSVRALRSRHPYAHPTIDKSFFQKHLDGLPPGDRTLYEPFAELPPSHTLDVSRGSPVVAPYEPAAAPGDLRALLVDAVERSLATGERAAVALSGGLDSAIVLAITGKRVPAYVLAPSMSGYDERAEALRTARAVGVDAVVVEVGEDDFRAALPAAVAAMEAPIYNAHPVAKLLLARAMARDGVTLALSGDGADHVMKRDRTADYLPLAHDLFRAAGVTLCSPFLDEAVVGHLVSLPPDPEKPAIRAAGAALGVVRALVTGPKQGRLAPPLRREGMVSDASLARLAARCERARPAADDERGWMRWITAAMLLDAFEAIG